MKKITETGIELWQSIATLLNEIVKEEGKLSIDDKRIWDPYLHTWTDTDWIMILSVLEKLEKRHPQYFKSFQSDAFAKAKQAIMDNRYTYSRIMDKRDTDIDTKRLAWKNIMCMREVWNEVFEIDLPIEQKTRTFRRTNVWSKQKW
jgi:hypothetical protein